MITKLNKIYFKNFRSFIDEQVLELPPSGLFLLKGASGAGKSSIGLGIAYALGYCPYPSTVLQSWGDGGDLEVGLEFSSSDGITSQLIQLIRGKKTTLKIDGVPYKGSASKIEEKLQELIGLTPEMVSSLTYRGQKKPGLFLSKPDSEKKEFLCSILGLDKIESGIEVAQTALKKLDNEATIYQERLKAEQGVLEQYQKQLEQYNPQYTDLQSLNVQLEEVDTIITAGEQQLPYIHQQREILLKEKLQKINERISSYTPQLNELKASLREIQSRRFVPIACNDAEVSGLLLVTQNKIKKMMEDDYNRQQQQKLEKSKIDNEISKLQIKLSKNDSYVKERAKLEKELTLLKEQICPTCNQFWLQSADRVGKIQQQISELSNNIDELQKLPSIIEELRVKSTTYDNFVANPAIVSYLEAEGELKKELQELQSRKKNEELVFENQKLSEVDVIRCKISGIENVIKNITESIEVEYEEQIHSLSTQISDLTASLTSLKLTKKPAIMESISRAMLQNERLANIKKQYTQNLEEQSKKVEELKNQYNQIDSKVSVEKDFIRLMGREGFLGSIFDEILVEIAAETNKTLRIIPNVGNVTLRFVSEVTTQKGNTKRTITPIVSVGGYEAPFTSGLSGGMSTSVELAVDLAIGHIIARRANCNPSWLFLDEAFDGLALKDKEACMEVLKQSSNEKLVFIIDHDNQFKEHCSKIIEVELHNGKSQLKVLQ